MHLPNHAGAFALRRVVLRTVLRCARVPVGFWLAGFCRYTLRIRAGKVLTICSFGTAVDIVFGRVFAETTALLAHDRRQRRLLRALLFKLVANTVVAWEI